MSRGELCSPGEWTTSTYSAKELVYMKKYLGTWMNFYCAFLCPVLILFSLAFAVLVLSAHISFSTIFIAACCFAFALLIAYIAYQNRYSLFAFAYFGSDGVHIKCLFSPESFIPYTNFNYIGIGMYVHGVMNTKLGSKLFYIIFSCEGFDEKLKLNINHWKASKTRIKAGFDPKLYKHLLMVLPPKQKLKLLEDYREFFPA